MRTDVILPFHNGAGAVARCLAALSSSSRQTNIILVNDGSTFLESERIRRVAAELLFPVSWVNLQRRGGFVNAVNAAWNSCDSPTAVVLNSDTVPPADLIRQLVDVLERDPQVAAVAPISDNPLDLYQHRRRAVGPTHHTRMISSVPYLTAMCVALRRSAIGGQVFDPAFSPGYFEDLDLSCRLRTAGWQLRVADNCRIHHRGRGTFASDPNLARILARNFARFSARWSHLPEHEDLVLRLSGKLANGRACH
jgi:GT2 family glycosyltransferase